MRLLNTLILTLIAVASFAQAKITGTVIIKATNEAIPFAPVVIQGTTKGANTDIDGNFTIDGLAPGLYNLECNFVGYKKAVLFEIEVTIARPAVVKFELEEISTETKAVEIVASTISNVEEAPLSVRTIGTNEIKRNPGGNRDISRAIRSLPGVAAIPTFRNDIIIRGGAANENRFYIDGIEIPNINHFATQGASGGPVGLINVDLIKEVEFYSGAFPAARGNALSSVLEFGFKDARRDKWTSNFVVGTSDLGITVEGPVSEKSGFILSARRSYLQGLFSLLGLPFLPTYNDFNLKWKTNINEKNQITIIGVGALDQFRLNTELASDSTNEDYLRNLYLLDNLVINEQWNYSGGIKWDHFSEKGRTSFILSRNALQNDAFKFQNNDESLPKTIDYTSRETENKFRVEHKVNAKNGWKFLIGAGSEYAQFSVANSAFVYNSILDTAIQVNQSASLNLVKYGVFLQSSKTLLQNKIVLSAGLRADGNDYNASMQNPLNQLSPRLSIKYRFAPQWSFNANTGIYYQLPSYTALGFERNRALVNTDASYIRNIQYVAGFEYDWSARNSIITLEGFYKGYSNYPMSIDKGVSLANLGADFGVIGNEELDFIGLGRSYGAEFLFQQRFYQGFYGILAYTYVRSEFTDINGDYAPSSWDSRHLLSLTGGKQFKKNWEIGGRFAFSGGLPYTPDDVSNSMLIANWSRFGVAITDWDRLNSERFQVFHQLDIRIDKKWFFPKWSLNLFLDIQNVYGRETEVKPILDVQRTSAGVPVVDPNDPSRFLPNSLRNTNGTVLPAIGIIVEL